MVTFELAEQNTSYVRYAYYPEKDKSKNPGIITYDRSKGHIYLTKLAESDFEREIPSDELNKMADSINRMKKENGETDYVEYTDRSNKYAFYGSPVMVKLCKLLERGEIPEEGSVYLY